MKKVLGFAVAVMAMAAFGSVASAQLLNEPFSYPDGNLVGNAGWTSHSGTGAIVVSGGQAVVNMTLGQDANTGFSGGYTSGVGGTLYAAFDVTVSNDTPLVVAGAAPNTSEYFAHFKDNTLATGTGFRGRVFATGFAGSDYTFGLRATSGTNPAVTWGTGFMFGRTLRLVVSYSYDSGLSQLWVEPDNIGSLSISDTGGALQSIAAFAFRQSANGGSDSTQTVDNLCVDTDFGNALKCLPEPSTLSLLAFGAVALLRRRR